MSATNQREEEKIAPEDLARAQVYGLLANLFYAPPPQSLLDAIAGLPHAGDGSEYGSTLRALRDAATKADATAVKHEYDAAFIGTGRQPVMLYASFYLSGFLNEKPLAELREDLARLGLARREDTHETEDHIAGLCDVMRFLVVGGGGKPPAELAVQRDFFRRYIKPCYPQLCEAVTGAGETRFYKHVANLARAFFALEDQAFDIGD
jgi:TorA maturation chaperone TorD